MYIKKVLAVVAAVALTFTSSAMPSAAEDWGKGNSDRKPFTDLTDHWAADAVNRWSSYEIVNGYGGLFRPDDSITRGEMAVILDNMMDYQVMTTNKFTDLKAGKFYTDAILKANAAGIIKGDGVTVRPEDKITREEAAVMLSRALAIKEATAGKGFADANQVSSWAKGAVFGMEAKGYVQGYNGKFEPKSNVTRAAAVTMIDNIVKAYYVTAGTYTENVAGAAVIKVSGVILKGVTVSENLIIAEGVAQGDVTLDDVTVKGNTVVRGGGENSVHIIGNSSITNVTIEKINGKIRIVIADGITVQNIEVEEGEEIILSGSIGTVQVDAPNVTLVTSSECRIGTIQVTGTAGNTVIKTEGTSLIQSVVADAKVTISGTGSVTAVTLKEGASGSGVTTPKTVIAVEAGVTGVTGGGGTAIPAGSTGTNNNAGTGASVTGGTTGTTGGGGGGGTPAVTVKTPVLDITEVTCHGTIIPTTGAGGLDHYLIPWDATSTNSSIDVLITNTSDVSHSVSLTIKNSNGKTVAFVSGSGITKNAADALSIFGAVTFDNFGTMLDQVAGEENGWYLDALGNRVTVASNSEAAFKTVINDMFARMQPTEPYFVTVSLTPAGGSAGSKTIIVELE